VVPSLRRATQGRVLGGVARGIAQHLRVDVLWVRVAFVALTLVSGAGVLAYAILWALVPLDEEPGNPADDARGRPDRGGSRRVSADSAVLLALGAAGVALGGLLLASLVGLDLRGLLPLVVAAAGAALIWLRADDDQRDRVRFGVGRVAPRRAGLLQVALGVGLVVVGLVAFAVGGVGLAQAGSLLVAVVVVVLGVALVVSPFALRIWRERDAERRARIRSEERAEIAAQVHDSVLQSLTLIQRNAADAGAVTRIARAQERDLRRWLYPPGSGGTASATSLRLALEEAAADVEDTYCQGGQRVDVVCVGDAELDERVAALVPATREALANAVRHSGADVISLYAEMGSGQIVVHVRDRGRGFDVEQIADDRMGVRESILARVERHGGTATVDSVPGGGTKVELTMPTDAAKPSRPTRSARG
jgi:signal transduction histidine kinase/phage shock protein PspC (stress-responsive transcriptional regulator)